MIHALWCPHVGLVHFGGDLDAPTLERVFTALLAMPADERLEHIVTFRYEEPQLGIAITGLQSRQAPLSSVDVARMIADAARLMHAGIEMRTRSGRANGAPFVMSPGTPMSCGACLSCGDALPAPLLFGRCRPCVMAFHFVTMREDVELPARQRQ